MEWGLSVSVPAIWIKPSLQQELHHLLAGKELAVLLVQEGVAGHCRAAGDG